MKEVLLVTDVSFWELSSGHRVRISALVDYLSLQFKLTVVITGPASQSLEYLLSEKYHAHFKILETKNYLNSNGYGRKLKAFLKLKHFDGIIIEYIHCSYFLNFLTEDCQVILDAHDIISERTTQFYNFNYQGALYEMSAERESELFDIYDNIIMISKPDFEKACLMTNRSKVLLCPHPARTFDHAINAKLRNITFIASAYLPNVDGINFFVQHCWDKINNKYHDIQLHIYGNVCDKLNFPDKKNIVLFGFAADLQGVYENADIILNPVRFGSGLKIKNVEALAHGKPLLTTTHGTMGIETGKGEAYLTADTTDQFYFSLSALIESDSLRKTLSLKAKLYIDANFSPVRCFQPLADSINNFQL